MLGRNSDTYLITWLATQLAGAIHVPVNFMLNAREVAYIVEHSGAALALADEDLLRHGSRRPAHVHAARLRGELGRVPARSASPTSAGDDRADRLHQRHRVAPKGAMLTHDAA